jgi:hypothetical protein
MSLIFELPDDLTEPLEAKASELNTDTARFLAALIREKLKLPVMVGELEVFAPADILNYELEREPGESNEEYEANKLAFGAVFRAAMR